MYTTLHNTPTYTPKARRPGGYILTPPPSPSPLPCPGRRPPTSPPAHGAHFPGEHPDDGPGGRRGIGGHREGHGGASGGVGRGPHEGSRSLVNLRGPGRGGIGMAPPLTPASLWCRPAIFFSSLALWDIPTWRGPGGGGGWRGRGVSGYRSNQAPPVELGRERRLNHPIWDVRNRNTSRGPHVPLVLILLSVLNPL